MVQVLNFLIGDLLPDLISRLDSWYIAEGVSVLGFGVSVSILIIVISAIVLRA